MRTRKILKTLKNCRAKRRVHVSICMSKIMCTPISRHIYVCDIHWLSNPGLWIYPSTYYVKGSCQIIKLCSLCVEIGFVVLHINNYIYIIYNIYIYIYIYIFYIYIYIHTMVLVRQNSILICYSEFHALAIVRHILCLFYLKR